MSFPSFRQFMQYIPGVLQDHEERIIASTFHSSIFKTSGRNNLARLAAETSVFLLFPDKANPGKLIWTTHHDGTDKDFITGRAVKILSDTEATAITFSSESCFESKLTQSVEIPSFEEIASV